MECVNCQLKFGLVLDVIDPEINSFENSYENIKSDSKKSINSTINIKAYKHSIRFPYSLNCSHKHHICDLCFDSKLINICPVCDEISNDIRIDSYYFTEILINNQKAHLDIELVLNENLTNSNIELNRKEVRKTLDKFRMKCYSCEKNEAYSEQFCFDCFTCSCKNCMLEKHSKHRCLNLEQIDFKDIKCSVHDSSADVFCIDDCSFICSDCCIKSDHKRHEYLEFYSKTDLKNFQQSFSLEFKNLKSTCSKTLLKLNNKISNLNIEVDMNAFRNFDFKKNHLIQLINLADSITTEINYLLTIKNSKIIYLNTTNKKESLENSLNEFKSYIQSLCDLSVSDASLNKTIDVENPSNKILMIKSPSLSPILSKPDFKAPPRRTKTQPAQSSPHLSKKTDSNNNNEIKLFGPDEFKKDFKMKYKIINAKSPTIISVIPETRFKLIEKIKHELNTWLNENDGCFNQEELEKLKKNDLISFKYKNGIYQRGKITDLTKNKNGLLFEIDGLEIMCSLKLKEHEIKKIPDKLKNIPELAINCFLTNLKPFNSETQSFQNEDNNISKNYKWSFFSIKLMIDWFEQFKNCSYIKFVNILNEFNLYEVDFHHEIENEIKKFSKYSSIGFTYNLGSVSLSETLLKFKLASEEIELDKKYYKNTHEKVRFAPMERLYPDQKFKAHVSHIDSLNYFYLKRLYPEDEEDINFYNLCKRMNEDYENSLILKIFDPEEGMPVSALYKDSKWYRGEIVKINPDNLTYDVMFVDYGDVCNLSYQNVRYLKKEYLCDEVSTFKCKLFGITFKNEKVYNNAIQYVFDTIGEVMKSDKKAIDVHVKDAFDDYNTKMTLSKTYEIILRYYIDNKLTNVNVMLTKLGFAECSNLSIYDGEKEQMRDLKEKHILKRAPVPTNLEKVAKEVKQMPNKVISTKPDKGVLCKVTNAISPSEIWVQDVVDSNSLYDQIQHNLKEKYFKLINQNLMQQDYSWSVNDLCCFKKSKRDEFYRCKIVERLSNGKFKILCLDNGFYETTEVQNLFELLDEFKDKPAFMAKKCFQIGVQPTGTSNGKWSSLAQSFTNETLTDHYVLIVFESDKPVDECYQVCIYIDTKQKSFFKQEELVNSSSEFVRFADILNSKGLAFLIEKQQTLDILLADKYSPKLNNILSSSDTFLSYKHCDLPKKVYKNHQNNLEILYDGLLTHYECSSQNELFIYVNLIKLTKANDLFKEMKNSFNDFYKNYKTEEDRYDKNFLIESLSKNKYQACVCEYESKFYRGEIIDLDECQNKFIVRLIDFGNLIKTDFKSIFRPMVKFINIERQAFKIKILYKLDDYDLNNLNLIKKFILKKLIKLKIDSIINTSEVDDNLDGLLIIGDFFIPQLKMYLTDYLIKKKSNLIPVPNLRSPSCKIPKFDMPLYLNNMKLYINVSWVDSVDKIWIQFSDLNTDNEDLIELNYIKKYADEFKSMQKEFLELYRTDSIKKMNLEEIIENIPVCCFYRHDRNLYRAVILSVDYLEQTALVRYIDFGNQEIVDFDDLYELNDKYKSIPEQAICFGLKNLKISDHIKQNEKELENLINKIHDSLVVLPDNVVLNAKFFIDGNKKEIEIYKTNEALNDSSYLALKKFVDDKSLLLIV